jgi:tRNA(His) guanylyltransferase
MTDSLGDRIKRYEAVNNPLLMNNCPVIIRVDGKSFHTWTRPFDRPFDERLMMAMVSAAKKTSLEMQGFKLAYVQSDEATFCITDLDSHASQAWFGNELNKIVSITASAFTAYFNQALSNPDYGPAMFDARAFNVPLDDAPNVFVWRQKDWARNSLQMLARAHFSHSELNGKNHSDIHEMLYEKKGVNWATECTGMEKNGSFLTPTMIRCEQLDWSEIIEYINPEVED